MSIHIPDVSEFQPNVDWSQINQWNGGYGIIRAAYGESHDDNAWAGGARRDGFWAHKGRALGIYQYLVATQDPAAQAHELLRLIGKPKPGEFLICDLEEGSGDQLARFHAWAEIVDKAGHKSWLYTGYYFAADHNLLSVTKTHRPVWLAAYQASEPDTMRHDLWQYTDSASVPGIPGHVDCSIFDGSDQAFLKLVGVDTKVRHKGHNPPIIKPPFAKLRVDGRLGPQTAHALNYWLGVPKQSVQITTITIRALQHHIGMPTDLVDGSWGKANCGLHQGCECETSRALQEFLLKHGEKGFRADGEAHPGGATFRALQRFLNREVGRHSRTTKAA